MRYFIPYVYGIETRAKTIFYKGSFIAYILFPNFLVLLLYYGLTRIGGQIINFILAFTAMYSIYEIGYFQNDTFTVRIENDPTYRLGEKEREYVERYVLLLIASRFVETIAIVIILFIRHAPRLSSFVLMLCMLYLAYTFYNSFRNRSNVIAIFFVLIGKYCAVPALFIPLKENGFYYVIMILAIPLYRTVEMAMATKRYGFNTVFFLPGSIDKTRMLYYLFALCLATILAIFFGKLFLPAIFLFGYLFLFRAFCFLAVKNRRVLENRKKCLKVEES